MKKGVLAEAADMPDQLDTGVQADILGCQAQALVQQRQFRSADSTINHALELDQNSMIALLAKASYESISNIKRVLARNSLAPSRSVTRRWHPVVIDHLEITLISLSS
jgi:hypothetical protein